jgi:hypothetical protein
MDEEQFELMYRPPGVENHMPLPEALDNLFSMVARLEDRNLELEQEVIRLQERLGHLEDNYDHHIH